MTSCVARFADAPEPALREQVANALFNKGVTLGALDRSEEELAVYDELARPLRPTPPNRRCANRSPTRCSTRASRSVRWSARRGRDRGLRRAVVARFGRRHRTGAARTGRQRAVQQGRHARCAGALEEELAVYDELLARFADAPEPSLREQVANALFNKGVTLGALERSEEAVAVYDELLARFADAPDALREQVANALFGKGVTLGALERSEEAVAVYDELLARFADAPEPALREQVANALLNKGVTLGALERSEEPDRGL